MADAVEKLVPEAASEVASGTDTKTDTGAGAVPVGESTSVH